MNKCAPKNTAVVIAFALVIAISGHASAAPLPTGSAVAKAILKYFGKEGTEEATEYLAKQGGREVAERVAAGALREGGEEAAEQVSKLAANYGPEALRALDNAPSVAPVLAALKELPESQVKSALARMAAGTTGRELAETVSRYGAAALRSELKHPGVGGTLVRLLGDDGAELATKLTTDQAIAITRHADDLAKLPTPQRQGMLSLMRNDTVRVVAFMGKFAKDNPGKTLFTVAATSVILAEPERILGGEEIVFDAEGNPVVVTKPGIVGRTMESGGKVVADVSEKYIRPLYLSVLVFVGVFASLFMIIKLYQLSRSPRVAVAKEPRTINISAKKS
ncbi:MAG: hypothetical protein AAFX06_02985 [Planctomycetota bacterium]